MAYDCELFHSLRKSPRGNEPGAVRSDAGPDRTALVRIAERCELSFAIMISDAKGLRISDIHIDVRAWEGRASNIVTRAFGGQRRFSVGTVAHKKLGAIFLLCCTQCCTQDPWLASGGGRSRTNRARGGDRQVRGASVRSFRPSTRRDALLRLGLRVADRREKAQPKFDKLLSAATRHERGLADRLAAVQRR